MIKITRQGDYSPELARLVIEDFAAVLPPGWNYQFALNDHTIEPSTTTVYFRETMLADLPFPAKTVPSELQVMVTLLIPESLVTPDFETALAATTGWTIERSSIPIQHEVQTNG